ncbi:ABC transporter permease [Niabella drilacis]|uniref:Peptide/nickel transport system permease protein n=1 Tax=Niabella drilacis (strain DSM 25811 / CCM 8410 / CCUG 62505 / LMG 26954 / E90) TaxID=1285928 RepID=A0A1G6YVD7_NIADE|nr:ABC transporter permease [Niabella drilacis]SDD93605.1 peptide/nickel transport system permease protein [Niabella drilacis]
MQLFSISGQAGWKRLKKNKGAVAGLCVILFSIFVAVFCYFLAEDSSPNANRIILEIGGAKPGSRQTFLKVKKEQQPVPAGFLQQLIGGRPDQSDYIPITGYRYTGDSVLIDKYIDEGLTETMRFAKAQLASEPVVTKTFWLGTDSYGRDILSRLIVGTRVSLSVGMITVLISISIGLILGSLAGFYRGRIDEIIMWFINVIWSIPTLLLVFAITLALGKGFWQVFIAVGLTMWVNVARLVRGQVLAVRALEYIEATRALGFRNARIIAGHIWPNIMGPVLVIAAANFASAIVIEAGLSFLGVGVQPPQPSWGLMIKENYNFIITQNPMLALAPGFAIMLLVLAFNLFGNGLRDALNVRGKL